MLTYLNLEVIKNSLMLHLFYQTNYYTNHFDL